VSRHVTKSLLVQVVLAGALITGSAHAQDGATMMGLGNASCGSWTAARRAPRPGVPSPHEHEQWVLGFLSGIGAGGPGMNPLNGVDGDAVWGWMDNYCQAHPLDKVRDAARTFALGHPH
jgi:hypothetical protein